MVNQQELDAFIARMEETYQPSVSFAAKSREYLQKLLDKDFPSDKISGIFGLAEQMYESHAQTRQNLVVIKDDLVGIVKDIHAVAQGVQVMADAYITAAEDLAGAAKKLEHASIEVLGTALQVKDAANCVQDEKRNDDAVFAPPKKEYKN